MSSSSTRHSESAAAEEHDELTRVATEIRGRHRSQVYELRLEAKDRGVVIRGRSVSFYGKQIVLHEVQQRGLLVVANEIIVGSVPFDIGPV